jgi:acyl-CoA thioester hydrolase
MRITSSPSLEKNDFIFTHNVRVRFSETDAMGVVHHSRYFPYLEETRIRYLASIGHPYKEVHDSGTDFAVIEAWLGYKKSCRFDDTVTVHLAIHATTSATFTVHYLLTVNDDVVATAVTVHGAVTHTGKPTRLPQWLDATNLADNVEQSLHYGDEKMTPQEHALKANRVRLRS